MAENHYSRLKPTQDSESSRFPSRLWGLLSWSLGERRHTGVSSGPCSLFHPHPGGRRLHHVNGRQPRERPSQASSARAPFLSPLFLQSVMPTRRTGRDTVRQSLLCGLMDLPSRQEEPQLSTSPDGQPTGLVQHWHPKLSPSFLVSP